MSCWPKSDYDAQDEGKIVLDELWKAGDKVLVIPDENEQHFFIVDIEKEGYDVPKGLQFHKLYPINCNGY